MDKIVKLLAVAVILGLMIQGALYGGAWMDDNAFGTAVLQTLGDNMTAGQMEKDIRTRAEQAKIPLAKPEDVKVTIDCGDGSRAPTAVTSRLGSAIGVTKSCTVTGTVHYSRRVGLMTKPVNIVQTKTFAAGATIYSPSSGGGVNMPGNLPRELPSRPIPD